MPSKLLLAGLVSCLWVLNPACATDKKTLHMGNLNDPQTLNPFQIVTADSAFIARNVYDSLVNLDKDGNIVPGQAESWVFENEGRKLVFKLRPGLKWSNGDPLTAEDFVEGFRYQVDPGNAFFGAENIILLRVVNARDIAAGKKAVASLGVYAPDALTLVIELETPVDHALHLMVGRYPLHKPTLKQYGESWAKVGQMVVNGAYMPVDWVLNERLVLGRNPHYYGFHSVQIGKVVLYPLTPEAELKKYEAGELDITAATVNGRFNWMVKRFGDQLRVSQLPAVYFYTFNHNKSQFQDKRLRQALSFAVDRKLITQKVIGYGQIPAGNFIPSFVAGSTTAGTPLSTLNQKQLENRARELFRQAGYGPDNPLEVEILYNTLEGHRMVALAVTDMWKRVLGAVKVNLRNMEWNALQTGLTQGEFSIVRNGWDMGSPNACFLLPLFQTGTSFNFFGFSHPEYDQYVNQACYSPDTEKRRRALVHVERILSDEMPAIPIYYYVNTRLVKDRVKGVPRNGVYNFFLLKDLSLEQN